MNPAQPDITTRISFLRQSAPRDMGYQPMQTALCYQRSLFLDRTSHGLVAHVAIYGLGSSITYPILTSPIPARLHRLAIRAKYPK